MSKLLFALNENGEKTFILHASVQKKYCCPKCGLPLKIQTSHFSGCPYFIHDDFISCDSTYDPCDYWINKWQSKFPLENREVIVGRYIADVKIGNFILALQKHFMTSNDFLKKANYLKERGSLVYIINYINKDIIRTGKDTFKWNKSLIMQSLNFEQLNFNVFFQISEDTLIKITSIDNRGTDIIGQIYTKEQCMQFMREVYYSANKKVS